MRQLPCSNFSGRALLSVQLHSCIVALSGWWPHRHRLVTVYTGHSSTLYKHCPTVSPWIAWIERRTHLLCLLLTKIWIKLHENKLVLFSCCASALTLPQWLTMNCYGAHSSHHNALFIYPSFHSAAQCCSRYSPIYSSAQPQYNNTRIHQPAQCITAFRVTWPARHILWLLSLFGSSILLWTTVHTVIILFQLFESTSCWSWEMFQLSSFTNKLLLVSMQWRHSLCLWLVCGF